MVPTLTHHFARRKGNAYMTRTYALIFGLAALGLASAGTAHAQDTVVPGDTFSFDIAGYNATSGVGYILGGDYVATFGATTTFTGAGYNGQNYTITSSEAVNGTTTTDTITVSTPTNFITSSSISGTKITALQLDLGDANSGSNPINVLLPISSDTATGNILYGASNTSFTLTPTTTLGTGSTSYSAVEGVSDGTTAISTLAVHSFTYAITYATAATASAAPEPSEWAAMAFTVLGIGGLLLRARKRMNSV